MAGCRVPCGLLMVERLVFLFDVDLLIKSLSNQSAFETQLPDYKQDMVQ